jgi:hypothetical protein
MSTFCLVRGPAAFLLDQVLAELQAGGRGQQWPAISREAFDALEEVAMSMRTRMIARATAMIVATKTLLLATSVTCLTRGKAL